MRLRAGRAPAVGVVLLVVALCASSLSGSGIAPASAHAVRPLAVPSPINGWTDVAVTLPVSAIAFDATRNQLLASVPNSVRGLGNDVVEVDPSTGAIGRSVFVGSNPGSLSVSADGTTLYVGVAGSGRVVRVDLSTFSVVSSFTTGISGFVGPTFARQVTIVPDNNDAVVGSLANTCCSPSFAGFRVYDAGLARKLEGDMIVDSFAFGPNRSTLYGYESEVDSFELSTWRLGLRGLKRIGSVSALIEGFDTTITYAAPYVYSSYGAIVDPATSSIVATIPAQGDAVNPVPSLNRVYYTAGSTLKEYRLDTYAAVSTKPLSGEVGNGTSQVVSTNVGLAALIGGALHLVGPGIGPASPIQLPAVRNHVHGLAAHNIADLAVNDIAYDEQRRDVLAAIGSASTTRANQVVEIDSATGTVGRHAFVGRDPGRLALSDDGSTLYVGLRGSHSIVELSLSTFTVVKSFSLGRDSGSRPYFAGSIAVQPGNPKTVAVTRILPGFIPEAQGGVAIYDDGIKRPVTGGDVSEQINSIAFGTDPNTLYASDTKSSWRRFIVMTLDDRGTHVAQTAYQVGGSAIVGHRSGDIFTECRVVDGATLVPLGNYVRCVGAIDIASDRVYGIDFSSSVLTEYEMSTFRAVKSVPIPDAHAAGRLLVTNAGFANRNGDGTLTLLAR